MAQRALFGGFCTIYILKLIIKQKKTRLVWRGSVIVKITRR